MPNYTVKQITGGTYNGSGGNPTSGIGGALTADEGDTILIFCMSAREETAVHYHSVVSIDSSTQTFSKIIDQDFTYTDATASPSFPEAAWHADVFVAVADGTLTSQSWGSTMAGSDSFVNQGYCTVMIISGLGDLDTNASNLGYNSNLTGSSSNIATDSITTDTGNPFLLQFMLAHAAGTGAAPTLTCSDAGYVTTVAGQGDTNFSPAGAGSATSATIAVFFQESKQGLLSHSAAGSSHGMWAAFNIAFMPPDSDDVSTYSNRFSLGQRNTSTGGSGIVTAVNTNFEGEFGTTWAQTVDGDTSSGPVQTNTPTVDSSYVEWVFDEAFICTALMAAGGDNNNFGLWKVYGSNDGTTYDFLGDVTWSNVANGAAVFVNQDHLLNGCEMEFTNTTAYDRYKVIYHSSFGSAGRYCYEMLFKRSQSKFNGGPRKTLITGTTNITESHSKTGLGDLLDDDFRPWHDSVGENLYTSIAINDYFKFQFDSAVIMHDVLIMLGTNADASEFGTWKWQRSDDDSTYTDEGSPFLFNAAVSVHNQCLTLPDPGGSTAAVYWRMLCTDATKSHNVFMYEWIFNVEGGGGGGGPVDGDADGDLVTATASIHYGDITAPGSTVTATASIIAGEAGEAVAVDGTRIFEFAASISDASVYSNADYDSVYSMGDRDLNGLIQSGIYDYPGIVFAAPSQNYDGNYATPSGSGFVYDGGTFSKWAHWIDFGKFGVDIRGFRSVGTEVIAFTDAFKFVGGIAPGVYLDESYAQEFDFFFPRQDDSPRDASNFRFYEYPATPRYPLPWPHYEFVYSNSGASGGGRYANEVEFKIAHSSLDGGDRRPGHAAPQKTVTASLSSGWTSHVASGFDTFALSPFDGANYISGPSYTATLWRGGDGSGFTPMSTPGEYMQFVFPRKVCPNYILFQVDPSDGEVYSGSDPTRYGKWHWEISTNGGSTWFQVGSTWWFRPGSSYMVAPHLGFNPNDDTAGGGPGHSIVDSNGTFLFPRSDSSGVPLAGSTHWRMVLESGPAFARNVFQVMFDLQDPGDTSLPLTAAFTDDTDNAHATLTIVPGNPRRLILTDNDSDALNATLTIIPNLFLTADFTDGDSDTLDGYGSFFPSTVVQVIINSKG